MLLLMVALQQVRAAKENKDDDDDTTTEASVASDKPTKKPLASALDAITLPDNTNLVTGTFEIIGLFLLVAGVVALVAHLLLGLDTAKKYYYPDPYPYTGPT